MEAGNLLDSDGFWVKTVEGHTTLFVPKLSLNVSAPSWRPVFYNTHAQLNRDVSIIVYRAFASGSKRGVRMADSLSGVGARGVRVAVEAREVSKVFMNDHNRIAIDTAKASAKLNRVSARCHFSVEDVCRFLAKHSTKGERFDIIDVDPFGCPTPYLDCALRALSGHSLISVTATDTAVLCGLFPQVAYRKYNGHSLHTEYCHEIGIRLLFGALAFAAMRLEIGMHPLFTHTTKHYIRIYASIKLGVGEANRLLQNIGYIQHCFKCGYRDTSLIIGERRCECDMRYQVAGPLWIGRIYDTAFLTKLEDVDDPLGHIYRKLFETARMEVDMPPTYYVSDKIASRLRVRTPSLRILLNALKERGFKATRTAINPKGVRTTAPPSIISEIVKESAKDSYLH